MIDRCPYCANPGCVCDHKLGDSCRCQADIAPAPAQGEPPKACCGELLIPMQTRPGQKCRYCGKTWPDGYQPGDTVVWRHDLATVVSKAPARTVSLSTLVSRTFADYDQQIASLEAENARLREQLALWLDRANAYSKAQDAAEAERDALRLEAETLREANAANIRELHRADALIGAARQEADVLRGQLAEQARERDEAVMLAECPGVSTLKELAQELAHRAQRIIALEGRMREAFDAGRESLMSYVDGYYAPFTEAQADADFTAWQSQRLASSGTTQGQEQP